MCGSGTIKWKDGRQYTGEWLNGNMHGYGNYVWADGKVYEGQF